MRSTKIIKICSSSLCTCLHHMVILRTRNKITDFLMILAWASPFKQHEINYVKFWKGGGNWYYCLNWTDWPLWHWPSSVTGSCWPGSSQDLKVWSTVKIRGTRGPQKAIVPVGGPMPYSIIILNMRFIPKASLRASSQITASSYRPPDDIRCQVVKTGTEKSDVLQGYKI